MDKFLKLEALLLKYIKEGKSFDDFVIAPRGLIGRSLEPDVISIQPHKSTKTKLETGKINIAVRRNGLYDALPEGLFHEIVQTEEDQKLIKQKTEAARTFFLPYEQEFFKVRFLIEQYERALTDGHDTFFQAKAYSRLWNIAENLTDAQIRKLLRILPFVPNIVGNLALTAHCFELLIDKPVSLLKRLPTINALEDTFQTTLGKHSLGKTTILGSAYYDGTPSLELIIKEIAGPNLIQYLPGGEKRKFLDYVKDFLIPFDVAFMISCQLKRNFMDFELQNENSRLGYSCQLKATT